jgi:DNA-binding NarL/FixJ family response regulator
VGQTLKRVVLVDDHALFRAGVRSELEGRVEIVGEAGTVDEAVALIERVKPDVVLLDVHMPDGGGVAVARRCPDTCFLALSVSDAPEDVISVIRAGARGYVTKTIDAERLADAIERVAEGDAVFSPRLAGFVLDAFRGDARSDASDVDQLTPREQEVLRLIARGYLYKEVAHNLGISAKTVEAHVASVLRKLQFTNRHELSRWAMEQGLD